MTRPEVCKFRVQINVLKSDPFATIPGHAHLCSPIATLSCLGSGCLPEARINQTNKGVIESDKKIFTEVNSVFGLLLSMGFNSYDWIASQNYQLKDRKNENGYTLRLITIK